MSVLGALLLTGAPCESFVYPWAAVTRGGGVSAATSGSYDHVEKWLRKQTLRDVLPPS